MGREWEVEGKTRFLKGVEVGRHTALPGDGDKSSSTKGHLLPVKGVLRWLREG